MGVGRGVITGASRIPLDGESFCISNFEFLKTGLGTLAKKKRENVGIFPKTGTPPSPPVWEFFPDFTVY